MIISNYNNQTIRIQSQYLESLLLSGSPDINILVTGSVNSCDDSVSYSKTIPPSTFWSVDLDDEVTAKMIIYKIFFRNTITDKVMEIRLDNDLAYVLDTCVTPPCTFETQGVPVNLKIKVDEFFNNLGITSNITVTATGNVLKISNIPEGFLPTSMSFWDDDVIKDFRYGLNEDVSIVDGFIEIKPTFFGTVETALLDGVYKFTLAGYDGTQSFREENCAFIDITMKCQVAKTLKNLIAESKDTITFDKENPATYIHLLHYSLVISSNCGCNCENLCNAYKELVALLESNTTTITNTQQNGCGC